MSAGQLRAYILYCAKDEQLAASTIEGRVSAIATWHMRHAIPLREADRP